MRVLITGAKGFIGKNLIAGLKNQETVTVEEFDKDTPTELLETYCHNVDLVFHLAGINRPQQAEEYIEGNEGFTRRLLQILRKHQNTSTVVYSSSIQAQLDNPYGRSKKEGEELLLQYARESGAKVMIYRFPNVFGKWCRPDYNSVIATFCHNIAHNMPITINQPDTQLELLYIDDLVEEFVRITQNKSSILSGFYDVQPVYTVKLENIAKLLYSFQANRSQLVMPDLSDSFTKRLYSTYLSYLPEQALSYGPKMHTDQRGSFTEIMKQPSFGQLSVNRSKPGTVKGNHWHRTKVEKFLVVSGYGLIRLRRINSDRLIEYYVSQNKLEIVDIPPGYTHNIENLGDTDLITLMWANESYDPKNPDTYIEEV